MDLNLNHKQFRHFFDADRMDKLSSEAVARGEASFVTFPNMGGDDRRRLAGIDSMSPLEQEWAWGAEANSRSDQSPRFEQARLELVPELRRENPGTSSADWRQPKDEEHYNRISDWVASGEFDAMDDPFDDARSGPGSDKHWFRQEQQWLQDPKFNSAIEDEMAMEALGGTGGKHSGNYRAKPIKERRQIAKSLGYGD